MQGLTVLREAATCFHDLKQPELNLTSDKCLVAPGSKILLLYIVMASFKNTGVLISSSAWEGKL